MGCSKCEKSHPQWADPQAVIYRDDESGEDYCIFHAPVEAKGITTEAFNKCVFQRINSALAENKHCELGNTVFPGMIAFNCYGADNPLPAISFEHAIFSEDVEFVEVCFGADVDFRYAIFIGEVEFDSVHFHSSVSYVRAKFFEKAYFGDCSFAKLVYFTGAEFYGEAHFGGTVFNQGAYFIENVFDDCAEFRLVNGMSDGDILVSDMPSSSVENVTFTRDELRYFSFRNCYWPQRLGLELYGHEETSYTLICKELYQAMKRMAAGEHDQAAYSNWNFREKFMQLKELVVQYCATVEGFDIRELPENTLIDRFEDQNLEAWRRIATWISILFAIPWNLRRSLYFWYWTSSGFGERPRRAGWWLGGLILLPLLFLMPLKLIETGWSPNPDWPKVAEIVAEWVRCMPLVKLEAAAPVQAPFVFAVRAGLSYLFQVAIGLQAALFALAVRNRFRR